MLGAEADAAARGHPQHERHARRAAHHEPQLGRLVEDLVERDAGEVGELELDDRPQPVSAAPMPQPTKPLSVSGVSRIRSAP